jgi:hypothetical protein
LSLLCLGFDIPFNEIQYIEPSPEEWSVPAPPEINFLVPQRKTWAKIPTIIQNETINTSKQSNNETRSVSPSISTTTNQSKQKVRNNNDNLTTTTSTTYHSDTNDIISELQDESRQHSRFLDEHNDRINT